MKIILDKPARDDQATPQWKGTFTLTNSLSETLSCYKSVRKWPISLAQESLVWNVSKQLSATDV